MCVGHISIFHLGNTPQEFVSDTTSAFLHIHVAFSKVNFDSSTSTGVISIRRQIFDRVIVLAIAGNLGQEECWKLAIPARFSARMDDEETI